MVFTCAAAGTAVQSAMAAPPQRSTDPIVNVRNSSGLATDNCALKLRIPNLVLRRCMERSVSQRNRRRFLSGEVHYILLDGGVKV
jgi:hypothetical protein